MSLLLHIYKKNPQLKIRPVKNGTVRIYGPEETRLTIDNTIWRDVRVRHRPCHTDLSVPAQQWQYMVESLTPYSSPYVEGAFSARSADILRLCIQLRAYYGMGSIEYVPILCDHDIRMAQQLLYWQYKVCVCKCQVQIHTITTHFYSWWLKSHHPGAIVRVVPLGGKGVWRYGYAVVSSVYCLLRPLMPYGLV